jgi:hypothetical protein
MKVLYIKPVCETYEMKFQENFLGENSEPEESGWLEGKENETVFFDDAPFGSLWDDDPVEDPFAIGD